MAYFGTSKKLDNQFWKEVFFIPGHPCHFVADIWHLLNAWIFASTHIERPFNVVIVVFGLFENFKLNFIKRNSHFTRKVLHQQIKDARCKTSYRAEADLRGRDARPPLWSYIYG